MLEVRKAVEEKLFSTLCAQLDPIFQRCPLGASFQISELNSDLNYNKNTMCDLTPHLALAQDE